MVPRLVHAVRRQAPVSNPLRIRGLRRTASQEAVEPTALAGHLYLEHLDLAYLEPPPPGRAKPAALRLGSRGEPRA